MADITAALSLISGSKEATLTTFDSAGPLPTAVGYTITDRGLPAILISSLSRHTKNLSNHQRVGLLIVEDRSDRPIHEKQRVSLLGVASMVLDPSSIAVLRETYLKRFPRAKVFFSLPGFDFYTIEPSEAHFVAGFSQAARYLYSDGQWSAVTGED